ncbi:MAG TPA: heparinase II/III family protein [Thermoguttaceae bacterium]|nr:heparinase II/III family protein [Thermoguttaceae bacterium]
MKKASLTWGLGPFCVWIVLGAATAAVGADPAPGATDWSDWEKYRDSVVHPATIIKPQDLARAKENLQRYRWAQSYVERLRRSADGALKTISPEYLERMIEPTTPGCTGPCPACRAKGLPWHPNGQWSWSASRPDQLVCSVCKTVFPNDEFPESVVVECEWGRGQKFTFIGGETFKCFGYTLARPSLSGIIRARKVSHVTGLLDTLATAYALTDQPHYARGAKAILLRFAEVFPEYLVRAGYGYGEYAGMDPHVAAERINRLPEDELVYPPNKPDRKIYTGYWSASRIGTSGMDGGWVVGIAVAYDLTCTARESGVAVYSDDEKRRIEHDLLLESTYLAACDPAINNKSVGNRAGAAVVGMCVGHPGLVRFGLEGFLRTVDGWFLPDGGTSESPAYAMMTMGGVRSFGLAFRDYSDPPGYAAPDGTRLDRFDACRDTRYGDCWQGLIWTLQGDLRFPPSADSYRTTSIGSSFAELIAVAYPSDEHVALLKEIAGKDLAGGSAREALFYREPGLEGREVPPLRLPDVVFPFLAQGYLRTGPAGRESLVMLNASDYGGHHHLDSLNLYYWKDGRELLSDLGYLWDHPDKRETYCTFAHNLVRIDGRDQGRKGRGGRFHLFSLTPGVKVAEASSHAYGPESLYRRTCVLVDHGPSGSYVVDVFRAGGGTRRDYVFHGPGDQYEAEGLSLVPVPSDPSSDGALPLENLRQATGESPWSIRWTMQDEYELGALAPGQPGEIVALGDGWGQRDHRNTDRGATLPYVVRRRVGQNGRDAFVTVFAANPTGKRLVESVRRLPIPGSDAPNAIAVAVETTEGTDLVVSLLEPKRVTVPFDGGDLATDGRLTAIVSQGGKPARACLVEGSHLAAPGVKLDLPVAAYRGNVVDVASAPGSSYFVVEGDLPNGPDLAGQTFFAIDGDTRRAYPIAAVEKVDGRLRLFTKRDGRGFEARPAERWELPVTAHREISD